MFYRALTAAVFTSLSLTHAVQAQEAANVPGPLFEISQSPGLVLHAVSDLPGPIPNAPVDYWELYFLAEPQLHGEERFDVIAIRLRIDCSAKTVLTLSQETYLNDALVSSAVATQGEVSRQIAAFSVAHTVMTVVCDPDQRAFFNQYPNWTAVRRSFGLSSVD